MNNPTKDIIDSLTKDNEDLNSLFSAREIPSIKQRADSYRTLINLHCVSSSMSDDDKRMINEMIDDLSIPELRAMANLTKISTKA
jgi:hypothetical protein